MVGAENGDHMGIRLFDEIDVLVDGVRRPLIPGFIARPHLCGYPE